MVDFLKRIKQLQGNSSVSAFARRIGVPQKTLDHLVKGERKPSVDVIIAIAKSLDVSADWLLGLSDKSSPNIVTHGSNSPVVNGSHNSVTLGESWQCSKCPYKKKLKGIEKLLK